MYVKIKTKILGGTANNDDLTGSCIYLEIKRKKDTLKVLVDLGMHQEEQNFFEKNSAITKEVDFSKINYLLLTHSHIDHIGRVPLLAKHGFDGRIITTKPTAMLSRIMLYNSAEIIRSEARYRRRQELQRIKNNHDGRKAKNKPRKAGYKNHSLCEEKILYTKEDVTASLEFLKNGGFDYGQWIKLEIGIHAKFYPSGHVFGGAICVIRVDRSDKASRADKKKRYIYLGFSGDLGRQDGIILPPPAIIKEPINFWFTESTYGGKIHPERKAEIQTLLSLTRTAAAKGAKILIPSFALERTQEIVYLLSRYMANNTIPVIPIYLDAPLANNITRIFSNNWNSKMFKDQDKLDFNPFAVSENPFLYIIEKEEESARLSKEPGPYIVIAGSGMCNAGRIRNHLRENLPKRNTIVYLVGYMVKNSLGRKLQEGCPHVNMNYQKIMVNAKIVKFSSFSAHADDPFLVKYAKQSVVKNNRQGCLQNKIIIVHGEREGGLALRKNLLKIFGKAWTDSIIIPKKNEQLELL